MNITELHQRFKVELDKNAVNTGIAGSPSFLPEEIDYWLYSAYLSKVSTKFTGNNPIGTPFEGNTKRIADLEKLVKTDKSLTLLAETGTNRLYLNGFTSTVTYGSGTQEKRMFFLPSMLKFGPTSANANVIQVTHEQASKFLQTYNNRPYIETPVAILENNTLTIYVDKDLMPGPYTLDLTYLAYPMRLNNQDVTSGMDEIPEYMQYEVIKLAADMAIENTESQRAQTHPQYLNISE